MAIGLEHQEILAGHLARWRGLAAEAARTAAHEATITSIQQDEPTTGLGGGDTPVDGAGVNTAQASVRAERSGKGNGRVYSIAFGIRNALKVSDGLGSNEAVC